MDFALHVMTRFASHLQHNFLQLIFATVLAFRIEYGNDSEHSRSALLRNIRLIIAHLERNLKNKSIKNVVSLFFETWNQLDELATK